MGDLKIGDDLKIEEALAKRRILILGGGFAGAYAAHYLEKRLGSKSEVEVALISNENFMLFTPMLHEVACADVSVTDIVQPLRKFVKHSRVAVVEVEAIDLEKKQVRLKRSDLGRSIDVTYEHLVLALGSVTNFFHTPGLEEHALTMKTLGDAIVVRNRVIDALELGDNQLIEEERKKTLTMVIAGGGFAGVETAGAINDLLRESKPFYRNLTEEMFRVVLVHPGEVILPELSESLGRYAQKKLGDRGVEIRLKTRVKSFDGEEVVLNDGTKIPTRMLVWTAGTTPTPLLSMLQCKLDRGRVVANEYMQVPGWPGVWALGDCAVVPDVLLPGKICPPTAQHAIRQAAVLAKNIAGALRGKPPQPFKFKMLGMMAAIGRRAGVVEILGMKFSGVLAWWMWRFIYLAKLPGFQKKVRVALAWFLDFVFSKDIVQLPTVRESTMSEPEEPATFIRS